MKGPTSLTRRLVLEERRNLPDQSGGFTVVWQDLGTIWASVSPQMGREDFVAGQVYARVKYKIIVRAAPFGAPSRPCPDQRFREGDRIFNILAVADAGPDGRYLEIYSEEGVLP